MEKNALQTPDQTAQNVDKIAEMFPNCISEMQDETGALKMTVNFDALKQALYDLIRPETHRRRATDIAESGTVVARTGGRTKIAPAKKTLREKAKHGIVTPRRGYSPPKPLPSPGISVDGDVEQTPEISAEKIAGATFLKR